jgi:ABC-type sugar transport system substrate-binding protein
VIEQKRALLRTGAVLLAAGAVIAGCGSSSSNSTGGGSTSAAPASSPAATGSSSTSKSSSGSDGLATAQRIAHEAETTAAVGPESGALTPDQITPASAESIKPTTYHGPPKSVIAIGCSSTSPLCVAQASSEAEAFKKMGWSATAVAAGNDYSPASDQSAMTNAIAKHPYAIITNGLDGENIGPQLAAAKAAGIFTVGANVDEASGKGFDQYQPSGFNVMQAVLASKLVSDLGAHANVHYVNIPQFPFIDVPLGMAFAKNLCSTCTFSVENSTAAATTDPTQLAAITSSAISRNPGLQAIAWPGDVPLSASEAAIRQSANPNVKQYSVDFDTDLAGAQRAHSLVATIGQPPAWLALQADDLVLRHAKGLASIPENQLQIGIMIITNADAPKGTLTESLLDNWAVKQFDFVTPYAKAWGVNLSSVL